MQAQNPMTGSGNISQLKKYAADLAEVYKSNKRKGNELEALHKQLVKYAEDLSENHFDLKTAHQELEDAYLDTIHRLVLAAEYKDLETGVHIDRMSRYSALLAGKLGLSVKDVQNILYAAPMHDIGKIAIPDSILMKPDRLTAKEFRIMISHTITGANILAYSKAEVLKVAEKIAISHHEQWSGRGYPQGLSGEDIPLVGRIVGLADVFDALTSKRPYKDAYPVEVAVDIIKRERGRHFDPALVDIFLDSLDDIFKIKREVDSVEHTPSGSGPHS
jgi:putative two-component system response regulator